MPRQLFMVVGSAVAGPEAGFSVGERRALLGFVLAADHDDAEANFRTLCQRNDWQFIEASRAGVANDPSKMKDDALRHAASAVTEDASALIVYEQVVTSTGNG